jgi:lysyl-tRNA synthetase class 2
MVGGLENVYELGRCFRNEGISARHSPEFTMLEWFQSYADYSDVCGLVEEMVADVAISVLGTTVIQCAGTAIDLSPPWRRVSVRDAIAEATGLDIDRSTKDQLASLLDEAPASDDSWADLVERVYSKLVERTLMNPTFVVDFPLQLFPLAKRHRGNPRLAEAFDAVIGGLEIVSGSTDINDPDEQRERFVEQATRARPDVCEQPRPIDEEFVRALEYGLQPLGGAGMGVDRLVMLLTGRTSLRDVMAFPH